ncbi:MAG: DUF3137 domain-containing protein [Gordonia sp. (in: high G+C Gram-positive bacteria)]|uniref:DUF3137 domain-containing protein n=1 Tax=Gordonia sp. (in: high G+C Gram-positive bacteria) TaxID=84139 RepID=UPI0039E263FF
MPAADRPTFDHPAPMRSVVPSARALTLISLATFIVLVVLEVTRWPLLFSTRSSVLLAIVTPALAFFPAGIIVKSLRRTELRSWAHAHGFTLDEHPTVPVPQLDIEPFTIARARRKRVRAVMSGKVGRYPAGYLYYTWWNNNRIQFTSHYRNVFSLTLPKALPALSIGPTISTRAGDVVEFESITFNEQWAVLCPDQRFAKAALPPTTLDGLLSMDLPVTANTRIAIVGRQLLAISIGGSRGDDITRLYRTLQVIADGIPRYVWEEYGR